MKVFTLLSLMLLPFFTVAAESDAAKPDTPKKVEQRALIRELVSSPQQVVPMIYPRS